jgi:predicted Fe-Mo cluster-binding NifX family protein
VDDQTVISRENRQNTGVDHSNHQEHSHNHAKFDLLRDCQTVIAGGMGETAFRHLSEMNISVYLVDEKNIQNALSLFLSGKLMHDKNRIHKHHTH